MFLYILNQIQTTGSSDYTLFIVYFVSIILGLSVIVVKSPVVSILYLIGLFCSIAVYLVKSGMVFAGLIYLLVYVGAISILFIFIIMLLNVRISELLTEGRNSAILAILAILSIDFIISEILPNSDGSYNIVYSSITSVLNIFDIDNNLNTYTDSNDLSVVTVAAKSWDNSIAEISHMSSVGNIFYNMLSIFILLVSFVILVAMVGAIVITVKNISKLTENVGQDLNSRLRIRGRITTTNIK